jgi:hypothetical protein
MSKGPLSGISTLLAVCKGTTVGDQVLGAMIGLLGLGVWGGTAWAIIGSERNTEERRALLSIFGASALAGLAFMSSVHHLGVEYLIPLSLCLAAIIGIVGARLSKRVGLLPGIAAAIVGNLALPVGVAVLLILDGFLGSGCLGEELG